MHLLDTTSKIDSDPNSTEVLRAGIDGGQLSVTFAPYTHYRYGDHMASTWALLLSDIAFHLVEATVAESQVPAQVVRYTLMEELKKVIKSERGTRSGLIATCDEARRLVWRTETDDATEIIRIIFANDIIHILARFGMWLKAGEEEANWANILYDLASVIAPEIAKNQDEDVTKTMLLESLLDFIEKPTTDSYSGRFY